MTALSKGAYEKTLDCREEAIFGGRCYFRNIEVMS